MASSKHQSQSLCFCFYNLPLFDDDNLILAIKMQDILLRSLISYSPYILELMISWFHQIITIIIKKSKTKALLLQSPPFWWWQFNSWNQDTSNVYAWYIAFTHFILPLCFGIDDHLISKLLYKLLYHPISLPFWQHQKAKVCGNQYKII